MLNPFTGAFMATIGDINSLLKNIYLKFIVKYYVVWY